MRAKSGAPTFSQSVGTFFEGFGPDGGRGVICALSANWTRERRGGEREAERFHTSRERERERERERGFTAVAVLAILVEAAMLFLLTDVALLSNSLSQDRFPD